MKSIARRNSGQRATSLFLEQVTSERKYPQQWTNFLSKSQPSYSFGCSYNWRTSIEQAYRALFFTDGQVDPILLEGRTQIWIMKSSSALSFIKNMEPPRKKACGFARHSYSISRGFPFSSWMVAQWKDFSILPLNNH